jgi:hypothetical protein
MLAGMVAAVFTILVFILGYGMGELSVTTTQQEFKDWVKQWFAYKSDVSALKGEFNSLELRQKNPLSGSVVGLANALSRPCDNETQRKVDLVLKTMGYEFHHVADVSGGFVKEYDELRKVAKK